MATHYHSDNERKKRLPVSAHQVFLHRNFVCVYVCVRVFNLSAFYPLLQNIHKLKIFKEKLDTELNNTVCACCFSGFTQCQKIKEQKQKTNLLVNRRQRTSISGAQHAEDF